MALYERGFFLLGVKDKNKKNVAELNSFSALYLGDILHPAKFEIKKSSPGKTSANCNFFVFLFYLCEGILSLRYIYVFKKSAYNCTQNCAGSYGSGFAMSF
jgi:hypothetical protein